METALSRSAESLRLVQLSETKSLERADAVLRHFSTVLVALSSQLLVPQDVVDGLLSTDSEVTSLFGFRGRHASTLQDNSCAYVGVDGM